MQARANFWIEESGQVVLSTWRVKLLEAVAETGSISAAAAKMGISYRRAWDKIHESEERLGVKLWLGSLYTSCQVGLAAAAPNSRPRPRIMFNVSTNLPPA